nr:hypothetical protein CFP56_53290 [Quercus suber]
MHFLSGAGESHTTLQTSDITTLCLPRSLRDFIFTHRDISLCVHARGIPYIVQTKDIAKLYLDSTSVFDSLLHSTCVPSVLGLMLWLATITSPSSPCTLTSLLCNILLSDLVYNDLSNRIFLPHRFFMKDLPSSCSPSILSL